MDADGSDQTRLTDDLGADVSPAWSPDGRYIVFSSDRSGNQEIYVMRADGSGISRLTDSADSDGWPAWTRASAPIPPSAPRAGSEFQWLVLTYKGDIGSSEDDFLSNIFRIVVEWVPEFQTASYWPDLLRNVHNFGITYCFPPNPGEFNVAIRFKPEMNAVYAFGAQGHDRNMLLQVLGVSYGMQLDHWEFVPGEQCVVRK